MKCPVRASEKSGNPVHEAAHWCQNAVWEPVRFEIGKKAEQGGNHLCQIRNFVTSSVIEMRSFWYMNCHNRTGTAPGVSRWVFGSETTISEVVVLVMPPALADWLVHATAGTGCIMLDIKVPEMITLTRLGFRENSAQTNKLPLKTKSSSSNTPVSGKPPHSHGSHSNWLWEWSGVLLLMLAGYEMPC
jgi:hypothetical protein